MKKSGLPAREVLFYTNIQILKDILNKGGLQNVQETSFNRHFEDGRPSKCPRNQF
jgi:hypothetical protein